MKITFRPHIHYMLDPSEPGIYAEFDVAEIPTDEQCNEVQEYIFNKAEKWRSKRGDISGFDFVQCCKNACKACGIEIIENPSEVTFYI